MDDIEARLTAFLDSLDDEPAPELRFRSYLGHSFVVPQTARFFVIKSYSLEDVNASFINGIWASTDLGNRRLSKCYRKCPEIFLLFSVNGSGQFCGIARMAGDVDFGARSDVWQNPRWKGVFPVEWLLVKDVPNRYFHKLKIPANDNKPMSNSRDTQEVPHEVAVAALKIFSSFRPSSSFLAH